MNQRYREENGPLHEKVPRYSFESLHQAAVARTLSAEKKSELKSEPNESASHERLFAKIMESLDAVTVTDGNGTILLVNDAFTRFTGYARDEVIGENPRILKSGRQSDRFYQAMWRMLLENGH